MPLVYRQIRALMRAEVRLLRRNSAVAATSTAFPIGVSAFMVYVGRFNLGPLGWALPVAILLLLMFGMTVYMTTTLALTARREDLYLKRLRSGEAGDATILVGVISPIVLLGLLQCALVVVIVWVFGPAGPDNVVLLALTVLLGTAMAAALGMATTGGVGSAQQADMATMPFFFLLIATGVWAGTSGDDGPHIGQLLLPGGAVVDLTRLAYDAEVGLGGQLAGALPGIAVLLGWTAFGALAVRRLFRWEPRH